MPSEMGKAAVCGEEDKYQEQCRIIMEEVLATKGTSNNGT